jgi:hypothetical protein
MLLILYGKAGEMNVKKLCRNVLETRPSDDEELRKAISKDITQW